VSWFIAPDGTEIDESDMPNPPQRGQAHMTDEEILPAYVGKIAREALAELAVWRERYPHSAPFIAEEARAKIDGREPQFPSPTVIGAGQP
jgi:hypothetical protein